MAGTVIPTITAAQFATRLAALFPNGWASSDAKQTGVLEALLLSFGTSLNAALVEVQYAKNATLITTETSPELDLASEDFFGDDLPRPPGMNDINYAALIIANLFKGAATREAFTQALTALTGQPPRLMDWWNPADTGAWNADSYWNVDNSNNPSRWSGRPSTVEEVCAFIETAPAESDEGAAAALNGNAMPAWSSPSIYGYWNVPGSMFFELQLIGVANLFALIDKIRAYGVTVGVKIVGIAFGGGGAISEVSYLATESGDIITLEDGDPIGV